MKLLKQISNTDLNHLLCNDFSSMLVTNTDTSDLSFSLACGRHNPRANKVKEILTTNSLEGDSSITDASKGCYILRNIIIPAGTSLSLDSMSCENFISNPPTVKSFLDKNGRARSVKTTDASATITSTEQTAVAKRNWQFFGQCSSGSVNVIISK
tara:strand:+ start:421 stop:885 length:465 start_codon:yes stop_codon:yes gene_type:complete